MNSTNKQNEQLLLDIEARLEILKDSLKDIVNSSPFNNEVKMSDARKIGRAHV